MPRHLPPPLDQVRVRLVRRARGPELLPAAQGVAKLLEFGADPADRDLARAEGAWLVSVAHGPHNPASGAA